MERPPTPPQESLIEMIFLSPGQRRLRSGWRILVAFTLIGIFLVLFSIPLGLLAFNSAIAEFFFWGEVATFLAVTIGVYIARRFLDHRSVVSLGLHWNPFGLLDLLVGIAIAGILMGLVYAAESGLGWLTFLGYAWQGPSGRVVVTGVTLMFLAFVLTGWTEELLVRGYILQNLAEGLNLFWAVIISSIIFAVLHLENPNVSWTAMVGLIAAGLFLAYGYVATRRLWLPIGLHIGWNFFEGTVFGFEVSGIGGLPRLIVQQVNGPDLITGGAFGPEAGLIILPVLCIGAFLIYLYVRGVRLPFLPKEVEP